MRGGVAEGGESLLVPVTDLLYKIQIKCRSQE